MSRGRRRHKISKRISSNHSRGLPQKAFSSTGIFVCVTAAIVIATVIAYWPIWENEFVNFDDDVYITRNSNVRAGLTVKGIVWAFTSFHCANWHPVTWLSHMLDCELYGLEAAGHHLTNLLFHTANALLLLIVLRTMTGSLWGSALAAGLFALHPLHVESVAWAAERKDVLSTFFWLLTMTAYARYCRHGSSGMYAAGLLAFALGLMAKPMLVSLPFVLLVMDYWPLGRFKSGGGLKDKVTRLLQLLKEKIPFFVLAAISCFITMYAQRSGGAVKNIHMLPIRYRIENALVSYVGYISKTFVPVNLAVYYPHRGDSLSSLEVIVCGAVLAGICVLAFLSARRLGWLICGWLWYLGTLVPVIGLMQVGTQAMADRYSYVPSIGLFIIVSWAILEAARRWSYLKRAFATVSVAALIALMVLTHSQVRYWRNGITLFEHSLAVTGDNHRAHFNLACAYADAEQIGKAAEHYTAAIKADPRWPEAYHNLAAQLFKLGKIQQAIEYYREALRLQPDRTDTRNNLALAYEIKGEYDKAIQYYTEAIELNGDYEKAYYGLAAVLAAQGKTEQAIEHYRKVLQVNPNNIRAKQQIGKLLESTSKQFQN